MNTNTFDSVSAFLLAVMVGKLCRCRSPCVIDGCWARDAPQQVADVLATALAPVGVHVAASGIVQKERGAVLLSSGGLGLEGIAAAIRVIHDSRCVPSCVCRVCECSECSECGVCM